MKLFQKSDRLGVAQFTHTTEEQPFIQIGTPCYCIVQAYLAWSSSTSERTIHISTCNREHRLTAQSHFRSATDLFMYNEDVTAFFKLHNNDNYTIRSIEPKASSFRWHLLIIYYCPLQPIQHLCVLLQEQTHELLWDELQANLPTITAQTNEPAKLYTLGFNPNLSNATDQQLFPERHNRQLSVTDQQILPTNYTDLQANCPHPFILTQLCPLPMPNMCLEQTANRTQINIQHIVTCNTKITNTGQTAAVCIQYRSVLPTCMQLVANSLTINDVPIPITVDSYNAITIILRDMAVNDLLLVSYQLQVHSQPEQTPCLHSATLDYHFYSEPNTRSIGNTPSNTVEYTILSPVDTPPI